MAIYTITATKSPNGLATVYTYDGLDLILAAMAAANAAAVADAVWDEATAGHVAAGSFGARVQAIPTAAQNADANWDEASAAHVAAGSTGRLLADIYTAISTMGATVVTGTHTITNAHGLVEQTIATITSVRAGQFEFQLDTTTWQAADTGTLTLRLYHAIDGANYRLIDEATMVQAVDTVQPSVSGCVQTGANDIQVRVQVTVAAGGNRACPFVYFEGA